MMLAELINLLYTQTCHACGIALTRNEEFLCTHCQYRMAPTGISDMSDNPVARMFWGRVRIRYATAVYHYIRGGRLQQVMHRLKYRGDMQAGTGLGMLMGTRLKGTCYEEADVLVPVPLHRTKQRKRGYNQSALIAGGLGRVMGRPVDDATCIRTGKSTTQTRKSRFERWVNVEGIFHVTDCEPFIGKHVLLVDDVVTTGATLEACAGALLKVPGLTLSVATAGVADLVFRS